LEMDQAALAISVALDKGEIAMGYANDLMTEQEIAFNSEIESRMEQVKLEDTSADDGLTLESFTVLAEAEYGCRLSDVEVKQYFEDYRKKNWEGDFIDVITFIESLNLNDRKG
jgi:hypothetical protein